MCVQTMVGREKQRATPTSWPKARAVRAHQQTQNFLADSLVYRLEDRAPAPERSSWRRYRPSRSCEEKRDIREIRESGTNR